MAGVPNVFGGATTSIPLSQLDANFNTTATLGNVAIGLGNVTTTVGNLTLTNVNITSGTINAAVTQSGFAANAVIYSTSTGNLTGNATIFSVNSTSVGIGTTSPGRALEVYASGPAIKLNNGTYNWTVGTGGFIDGTDTLVFYSGTAGDTVGRFNANGNLVLKGGTTSANGVGVTFPASQSASSDANCLDDYEEGTFSPTLTSGTPPTGIVYATRSGTYTKVGTLVQVIIAVKLSNLGTGGSGSVTIGSLPFVSGGSQYFVVTCETEQLSSTVPTNVIPLLNGGSTNVDMYYDWNKTGGPSGFSYSLLTTNTIIRMSFSYIST